MTEYEKALDLFYKLSPAEFGLLKSFSISQSIDPKNWTGCDIIIHLASSPDVGAKYLILDFKGAREIKIGSLVGLMRYVVDIRSVRDQQQEGLNYRIAENGHGLFSFVCKDFTAEVCG